jgi:hypothetical protein
VQFTLARTATRQPRPVELTLRMKSVTLPATKQSPELTVTALLAREEHPPENETPLNGGYSRMRSSILWQMPCYALSGIAAAG